MAGMVYGPRIMLTVVVDVQRKSENGGVATTERKRQSGASNKKEIMRLIVHGTKYIQGSRKAKVTPGKEPVVSRNSNGEGSKIEGRT